MSKNLFINNNINDLLKENEKISSLELQVELEELIKSKYDIGFRFPLIHEVTEEGVSKEELLKQNYVTLKTKKVIGNLDSKNNHYLIRGDNLFGLKALLTTHKNKINIIYIDPPYNTGNDGFPYLDSFQRSSWLSFMKRRLLIAKELLSEDGVIFVSIDDNEQAYLKVLMDEIFGEDSFVANFPKITTNKKKGKDGNIEPNHEYLISYSNNPQLFDKDKRTIYNKEPLKNKMEYGKWKKYPIDDRALTYSKANDYEIEFDNQIFVPFQDFQDYNRRSISNNKKDGGWRLSKNRMIFEYNNDFVYVKNGKLCRRIFENVEINKTTNGYKIVKRQDKFSGLGSLHFLQKQFNTDNGTSQFRKLFNSKLFSHPKEINFIKEIVKSKYEKDIILLDFFAGSGTTAHAVMDLNKEDGGNRQFIGIQLPEQLDGTTSFENDSEDWVNKTKINSIDEITIERIRRVIEGTDLKGNKLDKITALNDNKLNILDIDFIHKVEISNNEIDLDLYRELSKQELNPIEYLSLLYNQDNINVADKKSSLKAEIIEKLKDLTIEDLENIFEKIKIK